MFAASIRTEQRLALKLHRLLPPEDREPIPEDLLEFERADTPEQQARDRAILSPGGNPDKTNSDEVAALADALRRLVGGEA